MKNCPDCSKILSPSAKTCPGCGHNFGIVLKRWVWAAIVIFVLMMAIGKLVEQQEEAAFRNSPQGQDEMYRDIYTNMGLNRSNSNRGYR